MLVYSADIKLQSNAISWSHKLETATLSKRVPGRTSFFHSALDDCEDPNYSLQEALQQATLGICLPSMPCTWNCTQK